MIGTCRPPVPQQPGIHPGPGPACRTAVSIAPTRLLKGRPPTRAYGAVASPSPGSWRTMPSPPRPSSPCTRPPSRKAGIASARELVEYAIAHFQQSLLRPLLLHLGPGQAPGGPQDGDHGQCNPIFQLRPGADPAPPGGPLRRGIAAAGMAEAMLGPDPEPAARLWIRFLQLGHGPTWISPCPSMKWPWWVPKPASWARDLRRNYLSDAVAGGRVPGAGSSALAGRPPAGRAVPSSMSAGTGPAACRWKPFRGGPGPIRPWPPRPDQWPGPDSWPRLIRAGAGAVRSGRPGNPGRGGRQACPSLKVRVTPRPPATRCRARPKGPSAPSPHQGPAGGRRRRRGGPRLPGRAPRAGPGQPQPSLERGPSSRDKVFRIEGLASRSGPRRPIRFPLSLLILFPLWNRFRTFCAGERRILSPDRPSSPRKGTERVIKFFISFGATTAYAFVSRRGAAATLQAHARRGCARHVPFRPRPVAEEATGPLTASPQ